jgi:hypothetical protein
MSPDNIATYGPSGPFTQGTRVWLWLSIVAALAAVAGNIVGLVVPSIYAALTPAFLPQALAQDVADLAIGAPALLLTAALALRGSLRAYLLWLGVVTFTVYNYVIYAFSVPFGPLFLPWVAILGLSIYALIGGVAMVRHEVIQTRFVNRRKAQVVGWFLIVVAVLFAFLWLSEDVPALMAAATPKSVVEMGVPTNPVHVLDLAFFLPAVAVSGALLLKRVPLAHTLAPSFVVFLILTGIPILLTPVVQTARGEAASWGVVVPIGTLTLVLVCLLTWFMESIRSNQ